jgi:hypothetical protein
MEVKMNEPVTAGVDLESKESHGGTGPGAMCPMASMCSGILKKTPSRFLLMLPGAVLILLGAVILIQPQVLVWLVAAAAVLLGAAMLMMANLVHRFGMKNTRSAG